VSRNAAARLHAPNFGLAIVRPRSSAYSLRLRATNPLSSHSPESEKWSAVIHEVWPESSAICSPDRTSYSAITRASPAAANILARGVNATARTGFTSPATVSHRRKVRRVKRTGKGMQQLARIIVEYKHAPALMPRRNKLAIGTLQPSATDSERERATCHVNAHAKAAPRLILAHDGHLGRALGPAPQVPHAHAPVRRRRRRVLAPGADRHGPHVAHGGGGGGGGGGRRRGGARGRGNDEPAGLAPPSRRRLLRGGAAAPQPRLTGEARADGDVGS
jgi:hypothetical protein